MLHDIRFILKEERNLQVVVTGAPTNFIHNVPASEYSVVRVAGGCRPKASASLVKVLRSLIHLFIFTENVSPAAWSLLLPQPP